MSAPALNHHMAVRDGLTFFAGQPLPYLNALRDATLVHAGRSADAASWPVGKLAFGEFVVRHGARVPATIAVIRCGRVSDGRLGVGQDVSWLLRHLPKGQYFCKPDFGGHGNGAIRITVADDGVTAEGKAESIASVPEALSSETYIVQESLLPQQHPDLARYNCNSVNTLRLVTFRGTGGARSVAASLRIARSSSIVDNWGAGGIVLPVCLDDGAVGNVGVLRSTYRLITHNPVTGDEFGGRLPFFAEALTQACALHERHAAPSLGWDVAFTRDGVCFVECNRNFGLPVSMQLNPQFADAFLDFHLPRRFDTIVQLELSGNFDPPMRARVWLSIALGASSACGRVDLYSRDRMLVTVAGSKSTVASALRQMTNPRSPIQLAGLKASPGGETPQPGLDLDATFGGGSPESTAGAHVAAIENSDHA